MNRRSIIATAAAVLSIGALITTVLPRKHRSGQSMEFATAPPRSPAEIRQELFAEVQPVKLANCEFERFGEPHDGGYLL